MKIEIVRDDCPFNPRKQFDYTFTLYFNPNRYVAGDEPLTDDSDIWGSDKIRFPIYAHIHSGVCV